MDVSMNCSSLPLSFSESIQQVPDLFSLVLENLSDREISQAKAVCRGWRSNIEENKTLSLRILRAQIFQEARDAAEVTIQRKRVKWIEEGKLIEGDLETVRETEHQNIKEIYELLLTDRERAIAYAVECPFGDNRHYTALGFAVIAVELAKTDPNAANKMIDRAYEEAMRLESRDHCVMMIVAEHAKFDLHRATVKNRDNKGLYNLFGKYFILQEQVKHDLSGAYDEALRIEDSFICSRALALVANEQMKYDWKKGVAIIREALREARRFCADSEWRSRCIAEVGRKCCLTKEV